MSTKDKGRRQTLASMRPSQVNMRPAESAGRLSLAPSVLKPQAMVSSRQSLGGSLSKPTSARFSIGAMPAGNDRKSISRRSSVYGKSKVQDTRPIGDKSYTQTCIKHLITFLTTHNYDRPVSPKLLAVIRVVYRLKSMS
jgi:SMC interacting uncharacterized protein involved in chromosome segregation